MDLTSPQVIKKLLLQKNAKPSKGLGQNFLIDKNVLNKIIESADLKPSDTVLEIGPGIGTLTRELAQNANKVIAVEKDKTIIEILKETLKDFGNVEIVQADIRHYKLQTKNYKLVANIPYYLTSPLIRKFLESENQPEFMVLMLQKEVAQRICSKPPNMSLLSVSVQFYADAKIISYVPKNCFWPAPKVDSAIIKIVPQKPFDFAQGKKQIQRDLFFKIVKAGFSQPRKQLAGNLSKSLKLSKEQVSVWLFKNNISPTQRAETLSVQDWLNLTRTCG